MSVGIGDLCALTAMLGKTGTEYHQWGRLPKGSGHRIDLVQHIE